jgi:hypothetical protein
LKGHTALIFLVIMPIIFATTSCSLERKLAREFIQNNDSLSVLLFPPDYLFKTNLKTWKIKNSSSISDEDFKSALFDSSLFLKEIDDQMLISNYILALKAGLANYGMNIYTSEKIVDFFTKRTEAFQVAIVQMEIEEDVYPFRAEETFYDSILYYEDFLLEMITLSSWFEISKFNDTVLKHNILFASDYVMDGLEGRFVSNVFTGNVSFRYNYEPISIEHIYTLAKMLGQRHARYIFDFLMNRYIFNALPPGRQATIYFTFDPATGNLAPAGNNRFIFLEE